jgi:archaellin
MDQRAVVAVGLTLLVTLAGCQGVSPTPTPTGEETPTREQTTTPQPRPDMPPQPSDEGFTWRIGQAVGVLDADESVRELVILAAHPDDNATLAVAEVTILLQHDNRTYRLVHDSADSGGADGTFAVGSPSFDSPEQDRRFGTSHELAVPLSGAESPNLNLTAGDTVTVLVRTPNVTTTAVRAVVPASLSGEAAAILYGEFAGEDRRNESDVVGKPQIVGTEASALTDGEAGIVNVTVTKLPGSAPVDYRAATLRVAGPNGTSLLTHSSVNLRNADGRFGLTPVRDADDSAPVLTDSDRFVLTLDLGDDDTTVDDSSAGTSVGTPINDSFGTRLILETGGRQRYLRVAVPPNVTDGPVALRGVASRSEAFPQTNQRPVLTPLSSDSQRTANGTAVGGLSVNIRKPPTAAPIDPRTLTLDVATPSGTYRLVHPSREDITADGHFGVEHRFNPDGSVPVLDDYIDFARLTIDVGPNTRPGDDGPLGGSVGEDIPAGSLVTITVETEDGIRVPTQFYVPERDRN